MSAIKSAVCLKLTTADGSETEESFHGAETEAVQALTRRCRACCWSHTGFFGGEAIIYDAPIEGDEIIGIAQIRMLSY